MLKNARRIAAALVKARAAQKIETTKDFMSAIDKLLLVDSKQSSYQFDLANLTRQMLTNLFLAEFHKYEVAYDKKDREACASIKCGLKKKKTKSRAPLRLSNSLTSKVRC